MDMASRMAVPPRESIRARPASSFFMSLVNSTSRKASSLKFTTKTSSWGLEARTRSAEAVSTFVRFSRMLPLLSMMIPIETGTSSRLKILMGWGLPFSKTLKASCVRFVISLPLLSATLTGKTTSRVSDVKTGISPGSLGVPGGGGMLTGCWADARAASKRRRKLLRRRIVTEPEKGFERWKPAWLIQLHADMPIFPVTVLVLGGVVQHVLVPQLYSNFSGDIG